VRFDTLYLGGGTPSALEPAQLAAILDAVRTVLPLAPDACAILEANPEDVTREALGEWSALGVRGLSLGVQSFDDDTLRRLGRRHSGAEARRAVELAVGAGFDWVSLDLIYGTPSGAGAARGSRRSPAPAPRDAVEAALADVATAVALGPQHLSCYQLTVHAGTPFAAARDRGLLRELPSDRQATVFHALHASLAEGGYPAYEVSNFARGREHRSRHNVKYWRHVPYLGLGPSAHSFDGRSRWWNTGGWRSWAEAIERGRTPIDACERLGPAELALEALLLGLRTADGIALDEYRERYGVALVEHNARRLEQAVEAGLLVVGGGRLRPTTRGLAVADGLAATFALEPLEAENADAR
jgi:oxygen-independent coproporphyrinogen-3 oxidase